VARFGMAALAVLMVPGTVSAGYIFTDFQPTKFKVNYTGVTGAGGSTQTTLGHFVTNYWVNNTGSGPANLTNLTSYCATIKEHNSDPDGYYVNPDYRVIDHNYELVANDALVHKQLSYLLNNAVAWAMSGPGGSFSLANARAAVQAAVWVVTSPPMVITSVIGGTASENTAMFGLIGSMVGFSTVHPFTDTNNKHVVGVPGGNGGNLNQDMVIEIGGGEGNIVDPVPLPASVVGGLSALVGLFLFRRSLGIVA
jgi:hypothetical protein